MHSFIYCFNSKITMFTKNELENLVKKNQDDLKKNLGIKRDFEVKLLNKFATIISGIRRCGKSTLARQYVKNKKPIYYMYFEDVALAEFKTQDFATLDTIFNEQLGKNGIYFFDEIQNINGWEIYIRQLTDRGEKVLITGSNATMLSRELGTKLTGRNLRYELYPFSFNEFLKLEKKKPNTKNLIQYLELGGFPEYLKTKDKDLLRNLFQDIFYRDIIVRNDIRNESDLKSLLSYLSSNTGKTISYTKIKNILKIKSVHTVTQFINACENAYLFFALTKYDPSIKKQLMAPKKIYCIDNALVRLNSFRISPDYGRLLENLIFIELKRRGKEIYYHQEKNECDFLVKEKDKITEAIQVCYKVTTENKEREINGLIEALKKHNLKNGIILTIDQEDKLKEQGKIINIIPTWKWLLK
jgi:uncharacterized protein